MKLSMVGRSLAADTSVGLSYQLQSPPWLFQPGCLNLALRDFSALNRGPIDFQKFLKIQTPDPRFENQLSFSYNWHCFLRSSRFAMTSVV